MIKKREEWIDNLKGLGIILIVFGHCSFSHENIITRYIYTFHVPLFFFISGILYSSKKNQSAIDYVKSRFKRLIVPYFWFNIMAYIGLGIIFKSYHYITISGFKEFIINLLIGNYTSVPHKNIVNVATWFLPCLFFTGLYYYILDRFISNNIIKLLIITMLSVFVFIGSIFVTFRLPWDMEIALMGLFFYGLGNLFKKEITNFVNKINIKYLLLIPVLIFINMVFINNTCELRVEIQTVVNDINN